jgi:serine/threonine-protein kinase
LGDPAEQPGSTELTPASKPPADAPARSASGATSARPGLSEESIPGDGTLAPKLVPRVVPDIELPTVLTPPPVSHRPPDLPTVPGYEILGILGRGNMGVVYKARHIALKRLVALKMVVAGAHAAPERLARFWTEAEAVARLQHPHIVQIHEIGMHEGLPYCALEFVSGGSLDRQLGGTPVPARPAGQLIETLARAVHYAHQQGIVHRDLKPANILLAPASGGGADVEAPAPPPKAGANWVPKIADFGLAKDLGSQKGQTSTGAIMGTPSYMAPEQALGHTKDIGPATDVYALGAVLYELLTGRPPFLAETALETVRQVATREPVPPAFLQLRVPRDLETICLNCLHKEPRRRYASAQALADDLHRFLAGEPIRARRVGIGERTVKWAKRRPAAAALVVVSCLMVLSLLGVGLWYNARLRAERDRSDVARDRAEASEAETRAVVDEMWTEVGEQQLAYEPRMEQKRRNLLEKALRFYQKRLRENSEDRGLRGKTGLAYKRMADILRLLGENDQADRAYDQAITLLGRLTADERNEPGHRQDLADCHNFRGEVLRAMSRPQEAGVAYREAQRLQEALVREFDREPAYRRDLARTYYNLGILAKETNRLGDAENALRQAIALLNDLFRQAATPSHRQHLARGHLNLGTVLRDGKRFPEAQQNYEQAIALLKDLVHDFPEMPEYRHELGTCYNNLGNVLGDEKRYPDAQTAHLEAFKRFRQLAAEFPRVPVYQEELANTYNSLGLNLISTPASAEAKTALDDGGEPQSPQGAPPYLQTQKAWDRARVLQERLVVRHSKVLNYQGDLGMTLGNLGWLYTKRDQFKKARKLFENSIRYLRVALKPNPANLAYRNPLREQYQSLAETCLQLAEHAAAADAALELARVFPDNACDSYAASCFLARCARTVTKDTKLSSEKRRAAEHIYARQAKELLYQALGKVSWTLAF